MIAITLMWGMCAFHAIAKWNHCDAFADLIHPFMQGFCVAVIVIQVEQLIDKWTGD